MPDVAGVSGTVILSSFDQKRQNAGTILRAPPRNRKEQASRTINSSSCRFRLPTPRAQSLTAKSPVAPHAAHEGNSIGDKERDDPAELDHELPRQFVMRITAE